MHEFHGGALPGSGADRPRPPELSRGFLPHGEKAQGSQLLGVSDLVAATCWVTDTLAWPFQPMRLLSPSLAKSPVVYVDLVQTDLRFRHRSDVRTRFAARRYRPAG